MGPCTIRHERSPASTLVLVVAIALLGIPSALAAPRSALVLPPVGIGVGDAERQSVAEALRKSLPPFDLSALSAIETGKVMSDVETMGVACALDAVECIVQIGGIAAVDLVLAGIVAPREGGIQLDLLIVDVGSSAPRGRTQVLLHADPALRAVDVEGGLAAVLRTEVWRGTVFLQVDRPGAQVVVDGIARGFTPMKRPLSLSPGRHELFVGLEGFRAHRESLDVTYRGRHDVRVKLVPGPSEPPPLRAMSAPAPAPTPTPTANEPKATRKALRVALYEPSVAGVAPRVVAVMQDYLAVELRKRERVSVLGTEELRSFLRQGNDGADLASCTQDQCLSDVAAALGVDTVVLSQFTEVGGDLYFGLRRIDQDQQEVAGSYSARVSASDLPSLLPHVGQSIAQTFGDVPLRGGQKAGVDDLALRRLSPPPVRREATLALAVGSGALVLASAGLGAAAASVSADWNAAVEQARAAGKSTFDRTYTDQVATESLYFGLQAGAWTAFGLGVTLGAGTAAIWQLTDWENLANDDGSPR
jgi:hypothetical protein